MAESDNGITVILDTNLTPGLIEEGFVRELTSNKEGISADVLATDMIAGEGGSYTAELDINGEKVTMGVEKN